MMLRGTYVGIRRRLRGKTALLQEGPGVYRAQFDDTRLPEGFGWHPFPRTCFEVHRDSHSSTRADSVVLVLPLGGDAGSGPAVRDVRDDQQPGGAGLRTFAHDTKFRSLVRDDP